MVCDRIKVLAPVKGAYAVTSGLMLLKCFADVCDISGMTQQFMCFHSLVRTR